MIIGKRGIKIENTSSAIDKTSHKTEVKIVGRRMATKISLKIMLTAKISTGIDG